jgi:hypothetical protein
MKNNIYKMNVLDLDARVTLEFSDKEYSKIRHPEEQEYFIHIYTKSNNIDEKLLSYIEDMVEYLYHKKDKGKTEDRHYKIKISSLKTYIRNENKQPLVLNNLIVIFEELHHEISNIINNLNSENIENEENNINDEEIEHINLDNIIPNKNNKEKNIEVSIPKTQKTIQKREELPVKENKEKNTITHELMDDESIEIAQIRTNIRKELQMPEFEDFGDEMPELPTELPGEKKGHSGMNVETIPYDPNHINGEALMASLLTQAGHDGQHKDNEDDDDSYYRS